MGRRPVAQLIVRDLDPELVVELRRRAAESGRSAEAEHRELLRSVLKPGRKRAPLKSLLLGMPASQIEVRITNSNYQKLAP